MRLPAGLFAAALCLWTTAAALPSDVPNPTAAGRALDVTVTPVEVPADRLHGLALGAAYELTASDEAFGGISGLLVKGDRVVAITDRAHWITGGVSPPFADARIAPMTDRGGRAYGKPRNDSEGLTLVGRRLWVSFERDHRLLYLNDDGQMDGLVRDVAWRALQANGGLEALATLPDGRLLALGEEPVDGAFALTIVGRDGGLIHGRLPQTSRHLITGADLGPDGRLYILFRHWSLATGTSIRLRRYRLTSEGWPDPASAETLAAFESDSGIDNMEGLALWRDDQGRLRVWMISDDNFSLAQRTLLLDFIVAE